MLVATLLWFFFALFCMRWAITATKFASMSDFEYRVAKARGMKIKYDLFDVLGVLALIGIVIKYW